MGASSDRYIAQNLPERHRWALANFISLCRQVMHTRLKRDLFNNSINCGERMPYLSIKLIFPF